MKIVLFDNKNYNRQSPLTLTRAVGMLRVGMFTNKERWEYFTSNEIFIDTRPVLQGLYNSYDGIDLLFIDAAVIPDIDLINEILSLNKDTVLVDENENIIAYRSEEFIANPSLSELKNFTIKKSCSPVNIIEYPWHIMQLNQSTILKDVELLKVIHKHSFQKLPESVTAISPENIFIEESADVQHCILNASAGSIYIGKNAVVQEGALIRGPFVLGENSMVRMGAKIYSATIGPNCVVGGEIKNIVMFGNSNKAHDGYLGDSVIGEWCNFGAGTSNSNVKNTGGIVKVWNEDANTYLPVAQKCGLMMGDYSKTAINSAINTGSVIGVCCNVFGKGLTSKHVSNFSWGAEGDMKYDFDKALKEIKNWKQMKHQNLSQEEISVLKHIFDNQID